jgi:hypothetical protein
MHGSHILVNAELGHTSARTSTSEAAHDLACNKNMVE